MKVLKTEVRPIRDPQEIKITDSKGESKCRPNYQAETKVEDEGIVFYLEVQLDSVKPLMLCFVETDSLFELEDMYPNRGAEYEEKLKKIRSTNLKETFPNINLKKYDDLYDKMQDDIWDYINKQEKARLSESFESLEDNEMEEIETENEPFYSLLDDLATISSSPNYNAVNDIKQMLMLWSEPFYASFGNESDIRINIDTIVKNPEFPARDFGIEFKLVPEKYLKGIILTIPQCNGEFDAAYVVITFYSHECDYYVCEYIKDDNYGLRKNEDGLITLYSKRPSVDEIWNIVSNQYEKDSKDGIYIAVRSLHKDPKPTYAMVDLNDQNLLQFLFKTECRRATFTYTVSDGSERQYYIYFSIDNDTIVILRNNNGAVGGIQESDICDAESIINECLSVIAPSMRNVPTTLIYYNPDNDVCAIPENINEVAENAVINCSRFKQIVIKKGVERLQKNAFRGCNDETEVFFVENEDVEGEEYAFDGVREEKIHHLKPIKKMREDITLRNNK